MNIFLYIIIFTIGIMFGSFYTLAVYRIPKRQDIVHTHSYCPNCGNKLGFFELIPILSYILLHGKCKHCGKPIRKRYIILEIMSGILFVLIALGLKIDFLNIELTGIINFSFLVLYITCIVLISGIDKENKNIEKPLLAYGIIISIVYILYLCIIERASIYRYAIYLLFMCVLLAVDSAVLRKKAKSCYFINLLSLVLIMAVFTGEFITILSLIQLFVTLLVLQIIDKLKVEKNKSENKKQIDINNLGLAFILGIFNVTSLVISLLII